MPRYTRPLFDPQAAPDRGFTLIELMVTVAIVGILATAAYGYSRAASRNANVDGAMDNLAVQLAGLRSAALTDGNDRLFVYVDPPPAGGGRPHAFVLTTPTAAWQLQAFSPSSPAANVDGEDDLPLPQSVRLLTPRTSTPAPDPLKTVNLFDAGMMGTCGTSACFAIRFTGDGDVQSELPAGGTDARIAGFGFVLTSDFDPGGATSTVGGIKRRAIVVGFPTGIVKSYVP